MPHNIFQRLYWKSTLFVSAEDLNSGPRDCKAGTLIDWAILSSVDDVLKEFNQMV